MRGEKQLNQEYSNYKYCVVFIYRQLFLFYFFNCWFWVSEFLEPVRTYPEIIYKEFRRHGVFINPDGKLSYGEGKLPTVYVTHPLFYIDVLEKT